MTALVSLIPAVAAQPAFAAAKKAFGSATGVGSFHDVVQLTAPLLDCSGLKAKIADAKAFQASLSNNDVVDSHIRRFIETKENLEKAIPKFSAEVDKMERSVAIGALGVLVQTALLTAGLVVVGPVAIGSITAASIVTGTIFFGLQAVYSSSDAPKMIFGYAKDRTCLIGDAIAETKGTTGAKIVSRSMAILSLAIDLYGVGVDVIELTTLRNTLKQIIEQSNEMKQQLSKYSPNARALWRAVLQNNASQTIAQLEWFVKVSGGSDCLFSTTNTPIIRQP